MKKGDIYWIHANERMTDEKHGYMHPIICLEDTDLSQDCFHAAILSTKNPNSPIQNKLIPDAFFETPDNNNQYEVPNGEPQYLVKMGMFKHCDKMPARISGKMTIEGVNWVISQLPQLWDDYDNIEYYTIQEYINQLNNNE